MQIVEPFIYEYTNPYMKTIYNKQETNNKINKFFFKNTFEIYNNKYGVYEVFTPNLINYVFNNLKIRT